MQLVFVVPESLPICGLRLSLFFIILRLLKNMVSYFIQGLIIYITGRTITEVKCLSSSFLEVHDVDISCSTDVNFDHLVKVVFAMKSYHVFPCN